MNKDESIKSIKALLAISKKSKNKDDKISIIITTDKPILKKNDHTPRIIPIPNKFGKVRDKSILLITKDPVLSYRDQINKTDSDTENLFKGIYGVKKIKTWASSSRGSKRLYLDYDIIMADYRVHHKLHEILGPKFYAKNKKVPFVIQLEMAEQEAENKKKLKLKQIDADTCNTLYIYKQVKSILRNTHINCSDSGNTAAVTVGTISMKPEELLENCAAVLKFVEQLLGPGNTVKSSSIKTSESASMPLGGYDAL